MPITSPISPFTYDVIMETKLDIGLPGAGGGLDVGEGGSYSAGVRAFTYDASAGSGSRFSEIASLTAQNTLLGDAGDRLYIGVPQKFWGFRAEIGVAKVGGTQILNYSKGATMSPVVGTGGMVVLKDTADSIGETWLQQTAEKEYIAWDKDINADWVPLDNVLDAVPNTGGNLYWVSFQVPAGAWSTPPRIDEMKVRGSDFDVISGAAFNVLWGRARIEVHERIDLGEGSGPQAATLNITSTQDFDVKKMRSANADPISRLLQLPQGIDTSCPIKITLDYSASAAISTADILLDIKKLKNTTPISAVAVSDLTETTNIEVAAGAILYTDIDLNSGGRLDISDLMGGDSISIEIARGDSNGGDFYPMTLSVHYTMWTAGEHV